MSHDKKIDDAIMQIYFELYAASTPPADFNLLMEESPKNEKGQVLIPYDDYEIEEELFYEIIRNILNPLKIPKYKKQGIINHILMGCSPKVKRN